jgi:hypothetical protein
MASPLQESVRDKIERAEIHEEPFPHAVIPDLLPDDFFRELADSIPTLDSFQPDDAVKANLRLMESNSYFEAAPEGFKATWRRMRDEVIRETIAPILVRRLEAEIREKYAFLFSSELADEIMAEGLVSSDGRIMARKPGYKLNPHSDSAQYAVTCLLYFTSGEDEGSGALCLYRPEHRPELRHTSTYYPVKEEGLSVELVKEIPIRENLFVTFLNGAESLHSARVDPDADLTRERLAYQVHIVPRRDPRSEIDRHLDRLDDPLARGRWERYWEARSAKLRRWEEEKQAKENERAGASPAPER